MVLLMSGTQRIPLLFISQLGLYFSLICGFDYLLQILDFGFLADLLLLVVYLVEFVDNLLEV